MSLPETPVVVERGRVCLGDTSFALRASNDALQTRGLVVHGSWDPLLKRVELFSVHDRNDEQLVETLLHELAHARGAEEDTADRYGRQWVAEHPQLVPPLAAQIRQAAED